MEGLTFVITGVLESIERDEAKSLIERYGGKVTGNVSKKTNYLVMGRDCGQSKCEKVSSVVPELSRSENVKFVCYCIDFQFLLLKGVLSDMGSDFGVVLRGPRSWAQ